VSEPPRHNPVFQNADRKKGSAAINRGRNGPTWEITSVPIPQKQSVFSTKGGIGNEERRRIEESFEQLSSDGLSGLSCL
jgi:hypothetical protein